jgi:hypothetical protein
LRIPLDPPAEVRIANPVSFIAQKLLIHDRRAPAKRAQDVLYLHDTIDLFASHLPELGEIWQDSVRPVLAARTASSVERLARDRFREVTDVIRTAARIPQDRTLTPERLRALCEAGLQEIFGSDPR